MYRYQARTRMRVFMCACVRVAYGRSMLYFFPTLNTRCSLKDSAVGTISRKTVKALSFTANAFPNFFSFNNTHTEERRE